jgi:sortase (surface protein transpeptidase)
MKELLKAEDTDTLVLMTCAGELMSNNDATHRLIVTAKKS